MQFDQAIRTPARLRGWLALWALLLVLSSVAPAHAEESIARVRDEAHLLTDAQRDGLEESLAAQAEVSTLEGTILIVPSLDTWDLEAEANRRLEAMHAAGEPIDSRYLILVVPSQHRFALAHGESLADELNDWTREEVPARAAVEFESGAWEQGLTTLIGGYDIATLPPSGGPLEGANLRRIVLIAGVLLLSFTFMRASRRRLAAQ